MRPRDSRPVRSFSLRALLALLLAVAAPTAAAAEDPEDTGEADASGLEKAKDWFSENFEVHGFLRTNFFVRTPNFEEEPTASSMRNEVNLEPELHLYSGDDLDMSFYGVVRGVYDAVYDYRDNFYGAHPHKAAFGTGAAYPDNENAILSGKGKPFPGRGAITKGEATILNSDTGTFFTGNLTPAVAIDDIVFFGRVTAPVAARGRDSGGRIGGNADGTTYEMLQDNFLIPNAGLPMGAGLDASLHTLASMPLDTPLNFYSPSLQKKQHFNQSATDINAHENNLKYDCLDNAHPYCMFREFYIDTQWKDTFVRFGRQQIVWGKTDAFRLQDTINPIDFSYHNVFPSLEDRRIPVLALDAIQSFGDVGPLQDFSFEVAWVWDQFIPDQFGQCGEPWAFTAACEARADAGGHQLFNFSLAGVDGRGWKIGNTQPGARVEFRIPEPSISFSLSVFYGFQKTPAVRYSNFASVDNPNSASMLFLQGITDGGGTPLAGIIDTLAGVGSANGGPFPGGSSGVWLTGFDPYDRTGPTPTPGGTLEMANQDLQNAWYALTNVLDPANGGCAGVPDGPALQDCGAQIAAFGLPWSASEGTLFYPRIWSLGGSLDYQIPGIDTILRLELASDIDRAFVNTDKLTQISRSSVFKAAVGLDRSTFIPIINPNRTAFLSFQTFVEHIIDYDNGVRPGEGFVDNENTVVSTIFTQNYWRNDSLVLTNLFAIDWFSQYATLWSPKFTWVYNSHLSFDFGLNMLWGGSARHNIRNLCGDGTLSCFGDPTTWQQGNWQMLNGPLARTAQTPYWSTQSFADRFMRHRDEFWVGVTWQF